MSRSSFRGARVALIITTFVVHALLGRLLIPGAQARRRFAARNLSRYCRRVLRALNLRVHLEGQERLPAGRQRCLIVCNHLSYLDVLVISSQMSSLFVTSVEVEQSPGLGQICKAGGSLFVERRNRTRLARELEELQTVLAEGDSHLVVFAEATSSNGDGVLPFKNALFDSAVRSGAPVLPLCLRYTHANGQPIDRQVRDSIFYYGDMTFVDHFRRLVHLESIDATLTILNPISVHPESSRKELAEISRSQIVAAYGHPFGAPHP